MTRVVRSLLVAAPLAAAATLFSAAAFAAGGGSAPAPVIHAPGDAAAGVAKAAPCAACHGGNGNSTNPIWPKIAGQHANYLAHSLAAYKAGDRNNALMAGQVANLSEQDMKNLGAHFANQTMSPEVASEDSVELAEPLYRGGDIERGVPACLACHGPKGQGNPATGYPRVAGQHADYTAIALKAYRSGERSADAHGQMMTAVAKQLTDAEIAALASYIAGLQ